jgi:transglutaminase-like putative cysteine protease
VRRPQLDLPATSLTSGLAALTTWIALWSWAGFVQSPSGYLVPTLAAAVLVAVTGALLRASRVPVLLVLAVQLVLLAIWLTHRWTPEAALGGWLPTPTSLGEVPSVLAESMRAAQSYGAPVGDTVPEIFPILVATGALVVVLVDLLACGLRRVPVAGLPLLALYTAPVSILAGGVPWWVFAAGALSFLALLGADEGRRLTSWGRRVPHSGKIFDTGGGAVSTESLRSSARRIGLTATGLAVAAPLVIPTFSVSIFGGNGPGGNGNGNSVNISNPIVNLRRDLVRGQDIDLLRVVTDDPDPTYLRISVLDVFDGNSWKPSERQIPPEQRADGPLPRPPGLQPSVPRTSVSYEVDVTGTFASTWLPVPYPATEVDAPGDWRYDADTRDFISAVDGQTTAGLDYSLRALKVAPPQQALLDAGSPAEEIFTPYTDLPDSLPDRVGTLSRQVTAGLGTRFEKAVRLQQWFREDGGFEYSLRRAPGNGSDDLVSFLTPGPDGRKGYCEQFAAAMAVMGRSLGIPSRVAVGFLRPSRVGEDEYVYSSHDLHAWPEMYFDGVGWVRFEPTPSDRARGVPGYTTGSLNTPEPTEGPSAATPTGRPDTLPQERLRGDAVAGGAGGGAGGSGGSGPWVASGLLLVVLLLAPRLTRTLVRRRRWANAQSPAEAAEAGWREIRDVALDLRLSWSDTVTLRSAARSLATAFGPTEGAEASPALVRGQQRGAAANPDAAEALSRLVRDLEVVRYARTTSAGVRQPESVAADVEACVDALHAGATKRQRRLAAWAPASLVRNAAWRPTLRGRPAAEPTLADGPVDRAT